MGSSAASRPRSACFSSWMGSGRLGAGFHCAWDDRGTRSRKDLPAAKRSAADGPMPGAFRRLDFSRVLSRALGMVGDGAGEDCRLGRLEASSSAGERGLCGGEFQTARLVRLVKSGEPSQPIMKNYEKAIWTVLLTLLLAALAAVIFTHS